MFAGYSWGFDRRSIDGGYIFMTRSFHRCIYIYIQDFSVYITYFLILWKFRPVKENIFKLENKLACQFCEQVSMDFADKVQANK